MWIRIKAVSARCIAAAYCVVCTLQQVVIGNIFWLSYCLSKITSRTVQLTSLLQVVGDISAILVDISVWVSVDCRLVGCWLVDRPGWFRLNYNPPVENSWLLWQLLYHIDFQLPSGLRSSVIGIPYWDWNFSNSIYTKVHLSLGRQIAVLKFRPRHLTSRTTHRAPRPPGYEFPTWTSCVMVPWPQPLVSQSKSIQSLL